MLKDELENKAHQDEWYNDVNLRQAVHFIAFGYQPIKQEYEAALQRPLQIYDARLDVESIDRAKGLLFVALRERVIRAYSMPYKCNAFTDEHGYPIYGDNGEVILNLTKEDSLLILRKQANGDLDMPPYEVSQADWYWDNIDWQNSEIRKKIEDDEYYYFVHSDISIDFSDLNRFVGAQVKGDEKVPPSELAYTTPYLRLMHEAIIHFKITEKNYPKHQELLDWFKEKLLSNKLNPSGNAAKLMATFCRPPDAQTGGNKRSKSNKG